MKLFKFIATVTLSILMVSAVVAAPKGEKEIVTQVFDAHIHCESCEAKVMKTLPYKKGIKDVKVDIANQKITVSYDASKCSDQVVIESLGSVDVSAKVREEKSAN
ncbi:MAG: heavy metal-associated domain-containing protein [Rikenellaceae bacterium]